MQFGLGFFEICAYKMHTYAQNIQLYWKLKTFRPVGRVPFCITRKEPKSDWGSPSMSAFAQRALIGGLPPDPLLRGTLVVAKSAVFRTPKRGHPSCRSLAPPLPTKPASLGFGGDPDRTIWFFLPRGHRPLFGQKFERVCAVRTPPPWV